MNIRQLEHLLALAETASFSRAAEKLFITQSALSRSIQNLEEYVGGKVLDRVGKRNELTALGLDVAARARHIVRDAAELKQSAQLLGEGGRGTISVGLGSGPAAVLMVPLMCAVAKQKGMRVSVTQGPVDLQVMQLRSRQIDAMVVDMRRVVPAADLSIESVVECKAGFVARAGHPLAKKQSLTLQEVLCYPIASTPLSEEVARLLINQYGLLANPAEMLSLRSDDVTALVKTVEQSDAIFFGALAVTGDGLQQKRLRQLPVKPEVSATARYAYIALAGRTESPALAYFREFVRTHLGQI